MYWKYWSWSRRILVGLGAGAATSIILWPALSRQDPGHGRSGCQSNLKQVGLALQQYTQDYDEELPLDSTDGSAYGWADALQPYLKSTQLYQCPQESHTGQQDPKLSGYTDYVFNARLEGRWLGKMEELSSQVVIFDANNGTDLTDARYSFRQIPPEWRTDNSSPLYRHKGSANYLFGDGHVKALLPPQVEDADRAVRAVF